MTFDAVIVGGGIVGTACALAFSRAGMRVALVERSEIGAGATAAAMGHVVVLDDSPAQLALTRYSQKLWQQLASELPPDVEYTQRGTLWVAADDEEMQEICRKHSVYKEQGIPSEVLDAPTVAQAEPALRSGLAGGLLMHEDVVVSPQVAARFLLEQAGTVTLLRETVAAMGSGRVLFSNGDQLHAPILVNAAGEWASELTPGLPVAKRKGHLAITDPYPGFLRYQVVELGYLKSAHVTTTDTVACNVQPKANGQLLIGSSRQYGVEGREVEDKILARIFERAAEYLPALPVTHHPAHLDGFSLRNTRQAALDRPLGRRRDRLSSHRTRGPRHHHLARNRPTAGGLHRRQNTGHPNRALLAIPPVRPAAEHAASSMT